MPKAVVVKKQLKRTVPASPARNPAAKKGQKPFKAIRPYGK